MRGLPEDGPVRDGVVQPHDEEVGARVREVLEPGAGDSGLDVVPDGPTQRELYEAYEADSAINLKMVVSRQLMVRARPVVCEPCQRGGGPKDCVRPCVAQGHGTLPASDQPPGAR